MSKCCTKSGFHRSRVSYIILRSQVRGRYEELISLGSILLCSCVAMLMAENPSTIRRLPSVVAQRSFIGQTTAIPPTTLFKPPSKGIYRVTVSIEQSNTAGGYGPEAFPSWTGDFASYQEQVNGGNVYSGKAAANSFELTYIVQPGNRFNFIR